MVVHCFGANSQPSRNAFGIFTVEEQVHDVLLAGRKLTQSLGGFNALWSLHAMFDTAQQGAVNQID